MAEFSEVMRQWRRMCAAFDECEKCPQYREYQCYNTAKRVFEHGNIKSLESNVMKWAAEHKEPVYPTWGEWLEQQGICFSRLTNYSRVDGISIPQVFNYQIEGKTAFICGDKVNDPIPADIAQKLGIEPKEDV